MSELADGGRRTALAAWPGTAVPARRALGRRRRQLRAVELDRRPASTSACSTRRHRDPIPLDDTTYHVWHGYLPGVGPGPALRLPGRRAVRPAAGACSTTRTSCCVDPYARAIEGDFIDHPRGVRRQRRRLGAVRAALGRSSTTRSRGATTAARRRRGTTPSSTSCTSAASPAPPRHPARAARHLRRARPPGRHRLPALARRHGRRAAAGPPLRHRAGTAAPRAAPTTGATTRSASSRRTRRTRRRPRATRCASSRRWCARCTPPGIEVILDVVYNHTAEGGAGRPDAVASAASTTPSYYRLADGDPSRYADYTGCGNTLDPRRPFPLQLIMDSLRYWVTEMHVDGFRFDLASALARSLHDVDKLSSFFDTIHQDPVISQVKLIAEPWDVGAGGYQVGEFPPLWTEWNGRYRDTVRVVLGARRDDGVRDLAYRLSGSSDLYGDDGRLPHRVDQLRDRARRLHAARPRLLRAQAQRGQRRGQPRRHRRQPLLQRRRRGRSGAAGRRRRCGAAGAQPAQHAAAVDRRADAGRRRRAVAHAGRQQQRLLPGQPDLVARLGAQRRRPSDTARARPHGCWPCGARTPVLRQRAFFEGRPVAGGDGCKDLAWFHPAGRELADRLVRHRPAHDRHVPRRARPAAPRPARRS